MTTTAGKPLTSGQLDRAAGVLLATACGDALGAGYEFGPRLAADDGAGDDRRRARRVRPRRVDRRHLDGGRRRRGRRGRARPALRRGAGRGRRRLRPVVQRGAQGRRQPDPPGAVGLRVADRRPDGRRHGRRGDGGVRPHRPGRRQRRPDAHGGRRAGPPGRRRRRGRRRPRRLRPDPRRADQRGGVRDLVAGDPARGAARHLRRGARGAGPAAGRPGGVLGRAARRGRGPRPAHVRQERLAPRWPCRPPGRRSPAPRCPRTTPGAARSPPTTCAWRWRPRCAAATTPTRSPRSPAACWAPGGAPRRCRCSGGARCTAGPATAPATWSGSASRPRLARRAAVPATRRAGRWARESRTRSGTARMPRGCTRAIPRCCSAGSSGSTTCPRASTRW